MAPVPVLNNIINATAVSITWLVPSIAFTPENYSIEYSPNHGNLDINSQSLQGSTNLTATDIIYSLILFDLLPFTQYYYRVVSTNLLGTRQSGIHQFRTPPAGMWFVYLGRWLCFTLVMSSMY